MIYNLNIVNSIRDKLMDAHETVAVAESVTSGHMQAAFSMAENASMFFQGGITAYNIGQKCRHLNIDPIHAAECDCVSAQVAAAMAQNVCRLFLSNWGIGICGYASPVPEKGINELFAYYAIAHEGKIMRNKMVRAADGDAQAVQVYFTTEALADMDQLIPQSTTVENVAFR